MGNLLKQAKQKLLRPVTDIENPGARNGAVDQEKPTTSAALTQGTSDNDPTGGSLRRECSAPDGAESIASQETKEINVLRLVTLVLLITIATLASVGIFFYTTNYEQEKFEDSFKTNAQSIIDSFHDSVERKLGAINSIADAITSHALSSGETFPRVTLPHFEVHGGNARIQADALIVHWMPLVTDETRVEFEEYALGKRSHIDVAFEEDARLRNQQDEEFGLAVKNSGGGRMLQEVASETNETIVGDGTAGYHRKIWSNGSVRPKGDEPEGSGPYLPLWQRSSINGKKQKQLLMNFNNAKVFHSTLPKLLQTEEAIMNRAAVPIPSQTELFASNLAISQYRHDAEPYLDDPVTFLAYPVFDSFQQDRKIGGVLAANIYWRLFFTDLLAPSANGYICILENSYNQTLAYRIDGPDATYLGEGDLHDERYDQLEQFADINEFVQNRARPQTRSYTTVPLNKEFGKYRLRIYPSQETADEFTTNKPWVYTSVVLVVILLTTIILVVLDRIVARRQRIVMERLVKSAEESAAFEHELNAFLAHEVRNPLAAAMSAHSFVASSVSEIPDKAADNEFTASLQEDVKIIGSSLFFIDDFLRSVLDIHASTANKLEIRLAPTDLLKDVLEPVRSILHQRDGHVDVTVDCPENLVVVTDCLRLKQVMMNLGRNSIKFTTNGFVRFRAAVVGGLVELYVEDSGQGIPADKRDHLFEKFQTSLDVLSQGTGVGLSLCEKLVGLLDGEIALDDSYESGVPGSPGARFVIKLQTPCVPAESILSSSHHSEVGVDWTESGSRSTLEEFNYSLRENLSILFVDDDNVLRKLFSRAVKKAAPSWTISEAASGESALQLGGTVEFDLIFVDQYMASTEKQLLGTETVRALRDKGIDSTICGLSANNLEDSFLAAGADTFLLKPFPCDRDALERELIRITNSRTSGL